MFSMGAADWVKGQQRLIPTSNGFWTSLEQPLAMRARDTRLAVFTLVAC